MDELLALMDDDASAEEEEIAIARRQAPVIVAQSAPVKKQSVTPDRAHPNLRQRRDAEPQDRVEASIDNKLGIRMIKRRVSSIDLIDLMSAHPYHSTAAIGAMSLAALNRLLIEPTSVVNAATVCGKTSIVTVGIVFTNSGTRISSNGRAFSVLTIGNLQTGPVASVFLFGEAYSCHCAKCPPGTVVAIVTPNLLSPKEDSSSRSDTAVSLSVADHRQLIPIAQARDYGVCRGTVSAKRLDGLWISHGARCKHYVDTRVSEFCDKHRTQRNVKNGPVAKGLTFVQKERMERAHTLFPPKAPMGVLTIQMPGTGRVVTRNPANLELSIEEEFADYSKTAGRFLNAPMQMKKQTPLVQPPLNIRSSRLQGAVNRRQPLTNTSSAASRSVVIPQSTPVCEDWLHSKTASTRPKEKASLTGKKRVVNKDTGGFDGSVAVPKPSKLFRGKASMAHQSRTANDNQRALNEAKIDSIRQQQCLIAERQKENTSQVAQGRKLAKKHGGTNASSEDALRDSLFGQFRSVDTERLLNARSKFADEADVEAYANSRRIVMDLERREEHKLNAKTKEKTLKESSIQKEWVCTTCKRTTKSMPKLCMRAKHKVSFTRDVKKSDTVQERRLKLDGKSAEDGGLKLGAGLEWDRRGGMF